MSAPQRPTERLAFYEILTTRPTQTLNAPANTLYSYQGKRHQVVMTFTHSPLWFDADEDVEIENPDDESPEQSDA